MANSKTVTAKELAQEIATTQKNVLSNLSVYEIAALSDLQGRMLQRIHNDRKDRNGNSLGAYESESWKKARAAAGRQISEKDLDFRGDLRRSIKIGTTNGKNSLGFDNDQSRLIASGQEQQTKKEIYAVSENEMKKMDDAYVRELEFQMNKTY